MSDDRKRAPRLPPRWFIRLVWWAHRAICRVSGGRVGLWRPKRGRWGTARLTTTGRRTGQVEISEAISTRPTLAANSTRLWGDLVPCHVMASSVCMGIVLSAQYFSAPLTLTGRRAHLLIPVVQAAVPPRSPPPLLVMVMSSLRPMASHRRRTRPSLTEPE